MKFSSTLLATALAIGSFTNAIVYDESQREQICVETQQDCVTACYCQDKSDPKKNECEPNTLAYTCLCESGYVPPVANTTFSAHFATCNIKHYECKEKCGESNSTCEKCETDLYACEPNASKNNKCKTTEKDNEKKDKDNANKTKDKDEQRKELAGSDSSPVFVSYSLVSFAAISFMATYFSL
ncbi:hypothetical protein K502DRAFT_367493 [Neoconidiobolus thromboides FSU 785]|nr:hypothetical protein K502DRAFT_367493 [Neoconidiobolus thromboides FSU 785]